MNTILSCHHSYIVEALYILNEQPGWHRGIVRGRVVLGDFLGMARGKVWGGSLVNMHTYIHTPLQLSQVS